MSSSVARILIFLDYYLPGYRAGGPVRTISNMAAQLGEEFRFAIVTRDHDKGEANPYAGIVPGLWTSGKDTDLFYASQRDLSWRSLLRLLRSTPSDVIYLNSFFSPRMSLLPLLAVRLGLIADRPVVLAPRGEFSPSALALGRSGLKQAVIRLSRVLGLHRRVVWQASSEFEANDIAAAMGIAPHRIAIAADLAAGEAAAQLPQVSPRSVGRPLRVLFLSRIAPMKNLDYAIRVLSRVRVPVHFTIIGPREDPGYWSHCLALIEDLPDNVTVEVCDGIEPARVLPIMAEHDLLLLPSAGENYGHVIAEALIAGLPVLISDRTPWRGLGEQGVGCDLSLSDPDAFVRYIEQVSALDDDGLAAMKRRAFRYGRQVGSNAETLEHNRDLFRTALQSRQLERSERNTA